LGEEPKKKTTITAESFDRQVAEKLGAFFDGVGAGSTDEQIAAIAAKHPVFVLSDPHA